jgi:hypothetical protein
VIAVTVAFPEVAASAVIVFNPAAFSVPVAAIKLLAIMIDSDLP